MQVEHWQRPVQPDGTFGRYLADAVCKQCKATFHPSRAGRTTYCSRPCSFIGRAADRAARLAKLEAERQAKLSVHRCDCGEALDNLNQQRCDVCRKAKARAEAKAAYQPEPAKPLRCRECGSQTLARGHGRRRLFCSERCQRRCHKRIGKQVRRARKAGVGREPVDPLKVFDRDGWRCQLCGCSTPRRLRGLMVPRAPELDHIVPLARGGAHSYRNTQLACRACNMDKGAQPKGQQRLF